MGHPNSKFTPLLSMVYVGNFRKCGKQELSSIWFKSSITFYKDLLDFFSRTHQLCNKAGQICTRELYRYGVDNSPIN